MNRRTLIFFGALLLYYVVAGIFFGAAYISLLSVQALAFALIALGLNIQWGFGGLFNFGIMGSLMVGGFAATTISFPINPEFWASEGPMMLGYVLIAALIGAVLIVGAGQAHRIGITGRWKVTLIVVAWFVAYLIYRSQIDPAVAYIEATDAGWVGGLGLHPILGWIFGGVLAAGVAYLVGKVSLGLRTDYLAIATIGISEIIRALIKNMDWLTRGTLTVSPLDWPVPRPQDLQAMGVSISDSFVVGRVAFFGVLLIALGLAFFLVQRAYGGPWGRMMRAIRDNHIAAAAMGKDVKSRQLEIFIFGSVLMGIGGAALVTLNQIFDPGSYQPINHTFLIWVMLIVGGAGNNWGAVFGALFIYLTWMLSDSASQFLFNGLSDWMITMGWEGIPDVQSRSSQMRVLILGIVITLALRYTPRGLIPETRQARD